MGGEEVLRRLQPARLGPGAPALADDRHACLAELAQLGLHDALHDAITALLADDVALFAADEADFDLLVPHGSDEPFPDGHAVEAVAGLDGGHVVGRGVNRAVHDDDWHLGGGGSLGGLHQTFRVFGVQQQHVNALREHVLDVGDLLHHVVLGVRGNELVTHLGGGILGGRHLRGEVGRGEGLAGITDLQDLVLGIGAGEAEAQQGRGDADNLGDFFHGGRRGGWSR